MGVDAAQPAVRVRRRRRPAPITFVQQGFTGAFTLHGDCTGIVNTSGTSPTFTVTPSAPGRCVIVGLGDRGATAVVHIGVVTPYETPHPSTTPTRRRARAVALAGADAPAGDREPDVRAVALAGADRVAGHDRLAVCRRARRNRRTRRRRRARRRLRRTRRSRRTRRDERLAEPQAGVTPAARRAAVNPGRPNDEAVRKRRLVEACVVNVLLAGSGAPELRARFAGALVAALMGPGAPAPAARLRLRDRVLDLRGEARVMGIVNVTPDSFYERVGGAAAALAQARAHGARRRGAGRRRRANRTRTATRP